MSSLREIVVAIETEELGFERRMSKRIRTRERTRAIQPVMMKESRTFTCQPCHEQQHETPTPAPAMPASLGEVAGGLVQFAGPNILNLDYRDSAVANLVGICCSASYVTKRL
jgi:hypothetical protein